MEYPSLRGVHGRGQMGEVINLWEEAGVMDNSGNSDLQVAAK